MHPETDTGKNIFIVKDMAQHLQYLAMKNTCEHSGQKPITIFVKFVEQHFL